MHGIHHMTLKRETKIMEAFNAKNPVGTPVRYWTGLREGEGRTSTTRSEASLLSDHAVVWVEGQSSCISLTHVEAIVAPAAAVEATP